MATKSTAFLGLLGMLFVVGLAVAPAHAQASRTWVSGVGDDMNPCSRTAPCKTWAGAISKTPAGGEIDALDPGGFGALTITNSITLDGGGGQVASVLVSGTDGINVAAGSSDVIILRNLRFNGIVNTASPGTIGISVTSAASVVIEKCEIFGFGTVGVGVTPSTGTLAVKIQNSFITNNAAGVSVAPTGTAAINMSIDGSQIDNNTGGGIKVSGTGGGTANVTITYSSVSLNASNGVNAVSGASGNVKVELMNDVIADNGLAAVQSNNTGGGVSSVSVGSSMLSHNGSAWSVVGSATLVSFGNNQVTGAAGTGPSGPISLQ